MDGGFKQEMVRDVLGIDEHLDGLVGRNEKEAV